MKITQQYSNISIKIIIAMLLGIMVGIILNQFHNNIFIQNAIINGLLHIGGQIFIRSLKMIVVPVVFTSLVLGISNIKDIKKLGRIGIKTFIFYTCTTIIAITLALIIANIIKPGVNLNLKFDSKFTTTEIPTLIDTIINIVPDNPIKSMVEGNMLQLIVFSLLFGIAISLLSNNSKTIIAFFETLNEIILIILHIIIKISPIGVFCLISKVFANQGLDAFIPLIKYFICILILLLIQLFGTYYVIIRYLAKLNPIVFYKKIKDIMIFTFSTASSNASIPITLDTCTNKLGIQKTIASFTIPLGATINMDGTSIMQTVATIFIAQAYNIDIGITEYLIIILTATLASIGTAGIPSVGLITLIMILQQVNLPIEGIGLIIGIDRILDMCRTTVNVTGDVAITTLIAKQENDLDINKFYA